MFAHICVDLRWGSLGANLTQEQLLFIPGGFCREDRWKVYSPAARVQLLKAGKGNPGRVEQYPCSRVFVIQRLLEPVFSYLKAGD